MNEPSRGELNRAFDQQMVLKNKKFEPKNKVRDLLLSLVSLVFICGWGLIIIFGVIGIFIRPLEEAAEERMQLASEVENLQYELDDKKETIEAVQEEITRLRDENQYFNVSLEDLDNKVDPE